MAEKFKFDVVIGNPPYQEDTDNNRDSPIYHLFMEEAYKLSNKVSLITPGRFLFNVGQTPANWNKKMLSDEHLKVVYYEQNSSKIFPNTDIKGGIAITYRDVNKKLGPIDTFTNFEELSTILQKVLRNKEVFKSLNSLLYGNSTYKFTDELYKEFPHFLDRVSSAEKKSVGSNVFSKFSEIFFNKKQNENDIQVYGRENNQRIFKWTKRKYIQNHPNLEKYKVLLPGANGSGAIGEVLSTPLIGEPLIGYTQTFISFGAFDNKREAENLLKYIKTKFSRVMLGTLKITQNNKTKETWANVPLQDFTDQSDVPWHLTIPEIDQYLYQKYGLSQEEIDFIEEKVKAME